MRSPLKDEIKVAVLGMGHVGLPTALGFAELGWEVIGADCDGTKIRKLRHGVSPFYEPGLDDLLAAHLENGRFSLTDDVAAAIREATVLFLCVGTPESENGAPDLTAVEGLARAIACNITGYKLVVEKSTVPAITGEWIKRTVERHAKACQRTSFEAICDVASNPEFLREGRAIHDFFHPDRIVCGVTTDRAKKILSELYSGLMCPVLFTGLTTAELIKYAANAFLATKISFINMVADLCDSLGGDVNEVALGIGLDSRIGTGFLNAGLGFGGYCLPKDLRAFIHLATDNNVDCSLLQATEDVNAQRVERYVKKIREALWNLRGKTIAILGLAFKAGTDDVRRSPSFGVIEGLLRQGVRLRLYDPKAMESAREVFPEQPERLVYFNDAYEAATTADAVAILTEWEEFRDLDLKRLKEVMTIPVIVDGRNLMDPHKVRTAGFEYLCMGRSVECELPNEENTSAAAQIGSTGPAISLSHRAALRQAS